MKFFTVLLYGIIYVVIVISSHWLMINCRSIISGSHGDRSWMVNSEERIHTLDSKIDILKTHINIIEEKVDEMKKDSK